jgi:Putative Ig domain
MIQSNVFGALRLPMLISLLFFFSVGMTMPAQAQSANQPPTLSGTPASWVYVGSPYYFRAQGYDPEGATLRYSILNRPSWATFSTSTGVLSGTPTSVGWWGDIRISVSDGTSWSAALRFSIRATGRDNVQPVISGTPRTSVAAGSTYSFVPTASDANGDPLRFRIGNRPAWASFSSTTGKLSGTPTSSSAGTYSNITISVTDGSAYVALAPFSITVGAANRAPTISGTPPTSVTVGQTYSFRPTGADADGDAITFGIINRPSWATFSSATGQLSGTPTSANVGTYSNIQIRVSDGRTSVGLAPFTITVVGSSNRAPTISGTPSTSVTAGQAYSFRPTAADADNDTLGFNILNRPAWATFSSVTGQLSGTPTAASAGTYSNIVISVSDGKANTALAPFAITVADAPNRAPTISGTPSTSVNAGSAFAFRPTAADADGDTLTFAISNRPAWATFNAATGQLAGTPTATSAGTYSNIVISVSDGTASAALAAFSIAVVDVSIGAATLTWTPPTTNTDGSTLTSLAGYRIVYGTSAASLTQTIQLGNAGMSSYVVENLAPGTYYFAVRVYTSSGAESANSNVVTKNVQ